MKIAAAHPTRIPRTSYSTALIVLLFAVAAIAVPFSVGSRSHVETMPRVGSSSVPITAHTEKRFPSSAFLALAETIETFEADCVTPKSAFTLGETVCAKTDGVDLNYPGGRWVHWLRQDLSIAHGSSSTTLITQNTQFFSYVPDQTGTWKVTIAETGDISQTPAVFTVSLAPDSIATYESTCNLPQDNFTLNMGSVTVCAKADPNFSDSRFIFWVNDQGETFQGEVITSGNAVSTTTITAAGNYFVYFSASDGSLRDTHAFTVSDPGNPVVDLSVFKSKVSGDVVVGGFIHYEIVISNRGPDTASSVELTNAVPTNLTYVSSTHNSGPAFTRTEETPTTKWTTASLPSGASASFTFVYQVSGGTSGTVITNTAEITSTTEETHTPDNSSSNSSTVVSGTSNECTLDCPNDIVTTATTHGEGGGANVTFPAPEGFGNCGTTTTNPASGSFFPIGTTTVVSTSSTGGGGCSFTVTVVDSAAPTTTCPSNLSATANSGQSQAFVPDPNGSSSNVGTPTTTGDQPLEVTGSRDDGEALTSAYPVGTTDITWIVTDPSGRQATCTQVITILPAQALIISCPANVTTPSPNGCDPASVNPGTATTNSQTATITGGRSDSLPLTDPYPVGTTTITWTASDTDGQSASCTQTVTVTATGDTTPPTLTAPPNVTVTANACGQIVGESQLGTPTATDNCGTPNIARAGVPPGNFFPTGTTTITYTTTDGAGNAATATQTVTVLEDPAIFPTITAPADLAFHTGPEATSCGIFVGDGTLGTATTNDNCPGSTVERTGVPAGNNFPVGSTVITYTVTDRVGNSAVDTQTVTVTDNTTPTITAPANVVAYTGPGATSCSTVVSDATLGTASAGDNCPGVTVARTGVPAGNQFPLGDTFITYVATDAYGNSSAPVTQKVTVNDNTPPVVTPAADIVVYLPLNSTATSMVVNYPNPATATDNCPGTITFNYSPASGSTFPVGPTTVTVSATDAHNNVGTATFTVTVFYNFAGFFSPVNNRPTFNNVNAGRAIPLKFSLSGNKGLNIFAAGYPVSQQIACDTSAPLADVEGTETSGGSTLTYSPDQYHYNWKTESGWVGTCRVLIVKLNDGSDHKALFKFK